MLLDGCCLSCWLGVCSSGFVLFDVCICIGRCLMLFRVSCSWLLVVGGACCVLLFVGVCCSLLFFAVWRFVVASCLMLVFFRYGCLLAVCVDCWRRGRCLVIVVRCWLFVAVVCCC